MTFNPGTGPDLAVSSMALQNNGKAVIGGFFTKVNGTPRNYIARLDTSGILDGTFDPGTAANDPVYATALQQDGNVLVGGAFTNFNGVMLHGIARLHGDPVPVAPRLLGPMRSGNTFSASIATVSGKRYILQFKNQLSDLDWTSLPPVQGDGGIKLLQDTNANAANRFYRVRIE